MKLLCPDIFQIFYPKKTAEMQNKNYNKTLYVKNNKFIQTLKILH